MNQAHILIMQHHNATIQKSGRCPQSVHLSAVDVRAMHLGVELAERCHLAEHCQPADISGATACTAGLVGLTSPVWPAIAPGSRCQKASCPRQGQAADAPSAGERLRWHCGSEASEEVHTPRDE